MRRQTLTTEADGTTWLEVDGQRVEIKDRALFEQTQDLAAYNAALGNRAEPSFWGKLFRYQQQFSEREEAVIAEQQREYIIESDALALDEMPIAQERQPDGWDGDGPIWGGEGWCQ